ncbi:hypothetical protein H5410_019862 [Solanum commersonii]|uniref:Uncharacterized protein n=1 Tax=Solanum commersonii TaxID=4109 RepID=A0A9J5Z8J6_SOLCO|nr:hypothetical protein H5410_019862 [Solanum commersonii]
MVLVLLEVGLWKCGIIEHTKSASCIQRAYSSIKICSPMGKEIDQVWFIITLMIPSVTALDYFYNDETTIIPPQLDQQNSIYISVQPLDLKCVL